MLREFPCSVQSVATTFLNKEKEIKIGNNIFLKDKWEILMDKNENEHKSNPKQKISK